MQIGKDFNENCQQVNEYLFVVPWNPKQYHEDLHFITVTVVDKNDRKNKATQSFRFDEKQTVYTDTLAQFVLHTHTKTIFRNLFWFSVALCVTPLIFFRIWHELIKGNVNSIELTNTITQKNHPQFFAFQFLVGLLRRMRANCRISISIVQHYWILASVNRICLPLVLYCFYLTVGPYMYCEIAPGQYGFVFMSGIYLDGVFLSGSFTYVYGFIQLLILQCPLIWIYAKCLANRYDHVIGMPVKNHRGCSKNCPRILFYVIIIIEIAICIFFGFMFGVAAFISGIFQTWSIPMNILLYYLARNLPVHALR